MCSVWIRRSIPGGPAALAASLERLRRRFGPALHPEARISLRDFRRAAHLRIQPISVHAGEAGGARLLQRSGFRARSRRSTRCSCCRGTSGTSRLMSITWPRQSPKPFRASRERERERLTCIRADRRRRNRPVLPAGVLRAQSGAHRGGGRRSPRGGDQRRRSARLRGIRVVGGAGRARAARCGDHLHAAGDARRNRQALPGEAHRRAVREAIRGRSRGRPRAGRREREASRPS